jgi:hypothetical protein
MQDLNLFGLFTEKLLENNIDFFITGSVASIVYGDPRLTHDIDCNASNGNGISV